MQWSRRRGRLAALAMGAAFAATSLVAAPSSAQEEPPPPPPPVFDGGYDETPLPGFEEYAGCPLLNMGQFRFCLAITVNGDLQLGGVGGHIEDLKMVLAAAGGLGSPPVLVPAQNGGGPADVPVSGGILGIPELDPVLALDVLKLLSLSATPQMGELTQTGLDQIITLGVLGFAGYPNGELIEAGDPPAPLPAAGEDFCVTFEGVPQCLLPYPELGLRLPLTLKLNNLLLGDDCNIGPINLDLRTGTTEPPAGVAPLTGSSGSLSLNDGTRFNVDGMEFVGNTFEVPGADCAGVLGAGDLLAGAGLGNPFNSLINQQAGLPSPAGQNTARLTVDLHVARQDQVYGPAASLEASPVADFGDVPVGTTSDPITFTITNRRTTPRTFFAQVISFTGGHQATSNDCSRTLAPGESCEIVVTYTPPNTDGGLADVRVSSAGEGVDLTHRLTGRGV